jgi:hypothetical protein
VPDFVSLECWRFMKLGAQWRQQEPARLLV